VNTRRPDQRLLAELRRQGFSHVRLPVTPERLMETFSGAENINRDLEELDRAIDTLIGLGFAVSLDMHPGDKLGRLHVGEPQSFFILVEGLWRQLVRRYAGRSPDRLFFEVLNEPGVSRAIWEKQGPRLAQAIRSQAPEHTIIYGGANFQRIDGLAQLSPLADPNVVYAVHFYDPMIFTHQGQDWSEDPLRYIQRVPFPARADDPMVITLLDRLAEEGRNDAVALLRKELRKPWTEERIAAGVALAAPWITRQRRPVIMNEFGVLARKAPTVDRARWLETVRRAAEAHCIGWAHWEYADDFGFLRRVGDREIADEAVLKALLAP